jgi:HlyD family type I secretion membrane fusion protein
MSDYFLKIKKFIVEKFIIFKKIFIEKISGEKTKNISSVPQIGDATRFGVIVLVIFFGGFALWSILSPLETAANANGKIILAMNRKTIQHLEGGIIQKIFVREGSQVKEGDPLIQLDDTQPRANYDLWHKQANDLYATEARLIAERDNSASITFPEFLLTQQNDPDVQKLMKAQEEILKNDYVTLNGQLEILQQRIQQLKEQISSLKSQVQSNDTQLKYIDEELKALEYLDQKKLIEKTKLWSVRREKARLEGNRGEALSKIAEAEQKIGETEQQILTLKDTTLKDILKNLSETQSKLTEVLEKEKAAADILKRTIIVAPQAGTVLGLQEHTIGGVISPGKAIMDIVPNQDELIIEAKINPLDIDVVHPGLIAKVHLAAYKSRNVPWLEGKVTEVSADVFQDNETHISYYTARIKIPPEELKRLAKNVSLYPGMPVEVMIITDKRTPFDYFITPLKDSFTKAFREQ